MSHNFTLSELAGIIDELSDHEFLEVMLELGNLHGMKDAKQTAKWLSDVLMEIDYNENESSKEDIINATLKTAHKDIVREIRKHYKDIKGTTLISLNDYLEDMDHILFSVLEK